MITIKKIDDNHYYREWRDGDTVTSKHKGPVNPDEQRVPPSIPRNRHACIRKHSIAR